jgi:hypothetical protein
MLGADNTLKTDAESSNEPKWAGQREHFGQGHRRLADLVNNIAGMNCFNTLVIAAADLGYRGGSIYQDVSPLQVVWGLVAILMAAILLLGMMLRETHAIGNVSFWKFFDAVGLCCDGIACTHGRLNRRAMFYHSTLLTACFPGRQH